jgi:hypothetical protein
MYLDSSLGVSRVSLTAVTLVGIEHDGVVDELKALFDRLPGGWSVAEYDGRRYGVTRTIHTAGRSESVYAEALDGSDVVSTNLYRLEDEDLLKPCEMPAQKVLDFLRLAELQEQPGLRD